MTRYPISSLPSYVGAGEAQALLGVRRQTLYAYVSRGLIRAQPAPDNPRQRVYNAQDLLELAKQHTRSRARRDVAASAIDFGEPVLASAITRLGEDGPVYRGRRAVDLAESASLEEVAGVLWDGPCEVAPPIPAPVVGPELGPVQRCMRALAAEAVSGWQTGPETAFAGASRVLRSVAEGIAGVQVPVPIHLLLAHAWRADAAGADLVRWALVLCADHELNVSTFTARVVASAEASLGACVVAALAAVVGARHGGATDRVRSLLLGGAEAFPGSRDRRGYLPGFGHRLYPRGDARARSLRAAMGPDPHWDKLLDLGEQLTGKPPMVDAMLVVLELRLGLPAGAALLIFTVGRTAGWLAHALEQQASGLLIRPRAHYVGV